MAKFRLQIEGIGTEVVIGEITTEQYDYWISRTEEDLNDYCSNSETGLNVDEAGQICSPGEWYDLDGIDHVSGPFFNDVNELIIRNDASKIVFKSKLDEESLISAGFLPDNIINQDDPVAASEAEKIFKGKLFNEGIVFSGEFDATDFDVRKLKIELSKVDDESIVEFIYYDEKDIENTDASYDTNGAMFKVKNKGEDDYAGLY